MTNKSDWEQRLKKEFKGEEIPRFHSEIEGLSWDFSDHSCPLPHFDFSDQFGGEWELLSYHNVTNDLQSNLEILKDLKHGCDGILIEWSNKPNLTDLFNEVLFEHIQTRIEIKSLEDLKWVEDWHQKVQAKNVLFETTDLSLKSQIVKLLPKINGFNIYSAGGNAQQELTYVLWQLEQWLEKGQCNEVVVELGIGENFVIESSKFVAFQWLSHALLNKRKAKINIQLRAKTGWRNKSQNEVHSNQIRQTSEALSAILGGINQLCITPYDFKFKVQKVEISRRMALNVSHILKEEAHLDAFKGLFQGSYIAHCIIHQLCNKTWTALEFIKSEERGINYLNQEIQKTNLKRKEHYSSGKTEFIGMNFLVNPNEEKETFQEEINALGLPSFYYQNL